MWLPSTSASASRITLWYRIFVHVELVGQSGADGRDQRLDLGVLQHLVDAGPLDVEDLPPDGQDGLGARVAGVLGRSAGRVPLDDEQLRLARVARGTVGQLSGQSGAVERRLAPGEVAGALRGHAGPGRLQSTSARSGWPPWGSPPAIRSASCWWPSPPANGWTELPNLALVCPSNCGSRRRTEMMAVRPSRMSSPLKVVLLLLQEVAGPGVTVDARWSAPWETLLVHAALNGGDAVGEGVDRLVVPGVPLQGDLDFLALLGLFEGGHLAEQGLLRAR